MSSRMIASSAPSSAASSSAPEIQASVAGSIEPGKLDRDGDPGVVLSERTAGQQQSADDDRDQRQGSTQRQLPAHGHYPRYGATGTPGLPKRRNQMVQTIPTRIVAVMIRSSIGCVLGPV